ncbi:hypothetical protein PTKIN_Ptkin19aG0135100 [Pterospermum kingtungense]
MSKVWRPKQGKLEAMNVGMQDSVIDKIEMKVDGKAVVVSGSGKNSNDVSSGGSITAARKNVSSGKGGSKSRFVILQEDMDVEAVLDVLDSKQ